MCPDQALLAAVAAGDHSALRDLYDRHAGAVLRLLGRLTPDRGTAEEILQETWLAVWRSADSFRGDCTVRGWLMGVAKRQAHNLLRRPRPQVTDLGEAWDVADPAPSVEDQIVHSAERDELMAAIKALPAHLREVLMLVLVEDLAYQEVASLLNIPVGTVKSRMSQARRRLGAVLSARRLEEAERR